MPNKKRNLTGLIFLLIAVVLWTFWANPLRKDVKDLRSAFQELDAQVERPDETPEETVVLTDIERNLLDEAVPTGLDQEDIIKKLNNIAIDNIMTINNISFNRTTTEGAGNIQTVQIAISGRGSKANLKSFLHDLENDNRTFIINNISASYNQIGTLTQATFTLNIEAYFS